MEYSYPLCQTGIPVSQEKPSASIGRIEFSTTFHPQTDVQTERLSQILEDMLRAYMLDVAGSQDTHLHLIEFTYNHNYQVTLGGTF